MQKNIHFGLLLAIPLLLVLGLTPQAQADPVECEIVEFSLSFGSQRKYAVIDNETGVITVVAPDDANLRTDELIPEIVLPLGASLNPPAHEAQDFSQLVRYTVSIWNEQSMVSKEYIVRVRQDDPPSAGAVQAFSLLGERAVINEFNKTILVDLPPDAQKAGITPAILHTGEMTPAADMPQDFSLPVTYKFQMEDGTAQVYTVLAN